MPWSGCPAAWPRSQARCAAIARSTSARSCWRVLANTVSSTTRRPGPASN